MNYHEIKVDFAETSSITTDIKLKQFDYGNDVLRFMLYKDSAAYDPTADFSLCTIRCERSDGRVNENEIWKKDDESLCGITTGDDGVSYADVPYGLFESFRAGVVSFELIFYSFNDDGTIRQRCALSQVRIEVYKSISSYNIVDKKSIDLIAHILEEMKAFKTTAEAQAYVDMLEAAKLAEESRVNAEAWRADAENHRFESEGERVDAELERVEAENGRQAYEAERKSAEIMREDSEGERLNAEMARVEAENERLTAELARVEAENERVVAELARSESENQRLRAEIERVEAEKARVIAENERAVAEVNRNVKITEHDADITALKTSMSAASNDIVALEEKEKTLSENGALHSKDIAILKNDVSAIGGQTSDNAEDIARIKGGLTVVEKAKCDRNGNTIDATYAKKSELSAEISARNAFEGDITPRLAAVEGLADGNSKDIGVLADNVGRHDVQIGAIDSRLDVHDSEIGSLVDFVFADLITDVPVTLETKREYCFGEVEALSLVFPTIANAGDVIYLTFKSGEVATTLAIDTTNTTDIEVVPEANCYYDIFAKFNGSVWLVNYSEYLVSEV